MTQLLFNLFCRDVDAQLAFYADVLGAEELHAHRSPIYRALVVGDTELGFNAWPAYALLGLEARQPANDRRPPAAVGFATFQLASPGDVDVAVARASVTGHIVKPPFATYYAQWQAVIADPEDNVFRLACTELPPGANAPAFDSLGIDFAYGKASATNAT